MKGERYLIKSDEISALDGVNKTHFLNNNAKRNNKSLGDMTGLTGIGFHIIEVGPGYETTEYHSHFHEDECVYILSGTGEAIIGEDIYKICPGDFIGYRKGGLAHSIKNTGEETLRCIVVGQRTDHDVGDYPKKRKRIYRNKGLAWNIVDFENIEKAGIDVGKK